MQRRTLLKNLGGIFLLPALSFNKKTEPKKPVLRAAHITDVHLKDKWNAPARFERCLAHIQRQPNVDMILNGGDIVFDMNKENIGTINAQWDLWRSVIKDNCSLPIHYALGNHDIWWGENNKGQAIYGKQYSLDQVHLSSPYYSFTKNGWKFIVLDSVHLDIDGHLVYWQTGRRPV